MYSYRDRISYSEVDKDRNLTPFALVNYMQDCSCFHSEDIDYGLDHLISLNQGWFVVTYEIHINKMPRYAQEIEIQTFPHDMKGMLAIRDYAIRTLDGDLLVYARSSWVLMNLETNKPARITDEMKEAYQECALEGVEFDRTRQKIADGLEKVGEFVVSETCLDTNNHMNNSQYFDVTYRFIPEGKYSTILISYKKPARYQDKLDVFVASIEGGYQVVLKKDDEVYTIVEYKE